MEKDILKENKISSAMSYHLLVNSSPILYERTSHSYPRNTFDALLRRGCIDSKARLTNLGRKVVSFLFEENMKNAVEIPRQYPSWVISEELYCALLKTRIRRHVECCCDSRRFHNRSNKSTIEQSLLYKLIMGKIENLEFVEIFFHGLAYEIFVDGGVIAEGKILHGEYEYDFLDVLPRVEFEGAISFPLFSYDELIWQMKNVAWLLDMSKIYGDRLVMFLNYDGDIEIDGIVVEKRPEGIRYDA